MEEGKEGWRQGGVGEEGKEGEVRQRRTGQRAMKKISKEIKVHKKEKNRNQQICSLRIDRLSIIKDTDNRYL